MIQTFIQQTAKWLSVMGLLAVAACGNKRDAAAEIASIQQTASEQMGLSAATVDSLQRRLTQVADSLRQENADVYTQQQSAIEKTTLWLRHAQVLAIHDHCMPLMGDLVDYRAKLGRVEDSLRKAQAAKPLLDSLAGLRVRLQKADDDMMAWMRAYRADVPKQKIAYDNAISYLDNELVRIRAVDSSTTAGLSEAKNTLQRFRSK